MAALTEDVCLVRHSRPVFPYVEGGSMVDILVLGATGYTGRLITDVLQHHRERPSFSFGIAARSQSKLTKLQEELGLDKSVQQFVVDVTDHQQVENVISQASVVINTVGPFWTWGTAVVDACVKFGRHYVDLTGETHWIREIITSHDYLATTKRSIIVPACGMDSLPSDIVVYLANRTLKSLAGPETDIDLSTSSWRISTSVSAGSLRTVISILKDVPPSVRQRMASDYFLSNVIGVPNPPVRPFYTLPHSNPPVYGAAFLMALQNRAVVQRSWGLHEYDLRRMESRNVPGKRMLSYGPQFKYEEFLGGRSRSSAIFTSLAFVFGALFMFFPPTRWVIEQILPFFPEGPSEELKKNGFLEVTNITSSVPTSSKSAVNVRTVMSGQGEAGYYLSSHMIVECALALLLNRQELPALGKEGGILTPTTALGDVLVRRLEECGKFQFHSEVILESEENRKTR